MRKKPNLKIEKFRTIHPMYGKSENGKNYGYFVIPHNKNILHVIVSDELGWDHVSISLENRCPTWDEMSYIKTLFFKDNETVVQYHPEKTKYINLANTCLHLWKSTEFEYCLPPIYLV